MSTVLSPLYQQLLKDVKWRWTADENLAFSASKNLLASSFLLVHFNPKLKLILACDTSAYGIGAVLAHKYPDSSEDRLAMLPVHCPKQKKLQPNRKRRSCLCLWCEQIPLLFTWTFI